MVAFYLVFLSSAESVILRKGFKELLFGLDPSRFYMMLKSDLCNFRQKNGSSYKNFTYDNLNIDLVYSF